MNESSQKKIITRAQAQSASTATPYHITGLRVPFFEVDMGQAVYHGNYYHFFELGREDFLTHLQTGGGFGKPRNEKL